MTSALSLKKNLSRVTCFEDLRCEVEGKELNYRMIFSADANEGITNEFDMLPEICYDPRRIPFMRVKRDERCESMTPSTGNQRKWKTAEGYVKLDLMGYESIAETLTSRLLSYSNANSLQGYVEYSQCFVLEDGVELGIGCFSKNFIADTEQEFTAIKILEMGLMSMGLNKQDFIDFITDTLNISYDEISRELEFMLCVDAITKNEDRHFGNIVFLRNAQRKFRLSPVFDNGDSGLSDLTLYPITEDVEQCYKRVLAKPFKLQHVQQLSGRTELIIDFDRFVRETLVSGAYAERCKKCFINGLKETEGVAWRRI